VGEHPVDSRHPEEETAMAEKKIKVKLAHPLEPRYAARYGLAAKRYPVDTEIEVTPGGARDLAGAGYVQNVEPEKPEQVAALVEGKSPTPPKS
jgi:hypothetical protein